MRFMRSTSPMRRGNIVGKEYIVIRIAKVDAGDLTSLWDEVRAAEGLPPSEMLPEPEELERFDAGALAEWVIELTQNSTPIITGVLGYLVARRGEVEIGGMKFKNMSIKQIKEIIKYMDDRGNK